jgi:hypothetical protein
MRVFDSLLGEKYIDGRDIQKRIRYLEDTEDEEELAELKALQAIENEYSLDSTLIREDCFEDYARELAEEVQGIPSGWPYTCIDWEKAARELAQDYSTLELDGITYYVRD